MDLSRLLDWMKLPTKILAALCVVFAILVFSGANTLDKFGLKSLVDQYRAYLGVGFLVTLALTLVNSIAAVWKLIYHWIAEANLIRIGKKRLRNLTPKEKTILKYYIHNQIRNQNLPIQDGTVNALQKENIIVRASSLGSLRGFDYVIQPWAWEYLNKKPELLD